MLDFCYMCEVLCFVMTCLLGVRERFAATTTNMQYICLQLSILSFLLSFVDIAIFFRKGVDIAINMQ